MIDSKDGENRTGIGVDKGEGMRTIKDQGKSLFFLFWLINWMNDGIS